MSRRTARLALRVAAVCLACATDGLLRAAERIELREDAADSRIRKVEVELAVSGKLFPEPGPDKALKLEVGAAFEYTERRLAGTGREAQALRAIRHYDQARASIQAGDQTSNVMLRKSARLIVAQGQWDGVDLFSPSGPLTYGELELLRIPGDSLAAVGLLPDSAVESDETWKPADWVVPLITGVEAVEKHDLVCRLASVSPLEAAIGITGDVTGATAGAAAALHVDGRLVYDRKQKLVTRIELTQTEKRSIGAVSPGLDVIAKALLTRSLVARPVRLTDEDLAGLSLEANDASRLLMFDAPAWNVRFYHDRRWHLFHQTSESALLRLLDRGGLIAQCNIKKLPDAEPGQHVSQEQFLADIERTLGKNFRQIEQTEKLKLKEELFVIRVVVSGTVERRNAKNEPEPGPMEWIYYLVAHSDGRQIAFVFSLDPRQADELDNRDLAIVAGLEFLTAKPKPDPAIKRAGGK
jgi:hypothetical protein